MPDISATMAIIRTHCRGVSPNGSNQATDDKETDWKSLSDLPTSKEVLTNASSDDVPWFPIEHEWECKEDYLKALHGILRFEGVEGLRYSVKTLRERPIMCDDDNTCVYTKVRIQGYLFAKLGPMARVSFSTKRAGAKIKWDQSKRLRPGKIVALSSDLFKTDCRVAIVAQRPIEGGLDQIPPVVDLVWANLADALIDPDQELMMIESRNGYYEAVRHAMTGLQHAAQEWCPVDKYVVGLNRGDLPYPTALKKIDYSSLVDHLSAEQLRDCAGDKRAIQQAFRDAEDRFKDLDRMRAKIDDLQPYTSLDDSQLKALDRVLTKEVAIVQGPPGTGKTFTSVKSITAILKNRQAGDPPIIVAAQTNHALDQILIYCMAAGANIMRVGGRTENDEIKERTMFELRKAAKLGSPGQHYEAQRNRIIGRFEVLVNGVFGGGALIDPDLLRESGVITESQHKSFNDDEWEGVEDEPAMDTWLGVEKTERFRQQIEDDEFEDFEVDAATEELFETDLNFNDDKQGDDDDDRIYGKFVPLSSRFTGRRPTYANWELHCKTLLKNSDNIYDVPRKFRGGVYMVMEKILRDATASKFRAVLDEATKQAQDWKAACWVRDLSIITRQNINIVGCTTTGLTKYRGFLAAILPSVLLIEEAAETREANVSSALFPSLKQLILVGDHQQLPPSCDIARLAQHPFNLNISLFQRLIENRLPYTMLYHQRRMAPELSYIVKKFYPELKDHPVVMDPKKRPLVPGMGERRSWFFTHQWPEDTDADNSKFNQPEVEMVVAFIRYLLHNNVQASEITVLTYYKGQKRKLLQRLRQKDIPIGNFFNVATVDSYQGEENEIVILSLVRSPAPGRDPNVGFLDSRNRATVAISRARRGFFMFGNKENLLRAWQDSFITWAPIWNAFAEQKRVAMGKGLPLVCQNHGNLIWVKDPDDLVGNAGGCWKKCGGELVCGHVCVLNCHNITHEKVPCLQPCKGTLPCGHKCAGYCSDPCRCAVNCPAYLRIRLETQLAETQARETQARARTHYKGSDARLVCPEVVRQTGTSRPNDWQEMANNPEAHDGAMRATHRQIMGDTKAAEVTLQRAFENIKETFIQVSSTEHCARVKVPGSRQTRDIRKESRSEQQSVAASMGLDSASSTGHGDGEILHTQCFTPTPKMTPAGLLTARPYVGTEGTRDAGPGISRQHNQQHINAIAKATTWSSAVQKKEGTSGLEEHGVIKTKGRDSRPNSRGGFRVDQQQDTRTHGPTRLVPINTIKANAATAIFGDWSNSGIFETPDSAAFTMPPQLLQQEINPDSASTIGDLGFEGEMQQAIELERKERAYRQTIPKRPRIQAAQAPKQLPGTESDQNIQQQPHILSNQVIQATQERPRTYLSKQPAQVESPLLINFGEGASDYVDMGEAQIAKSHNDEKTGNQKLLEDLM